jgi:hypothetical protein
MDQPKTVLLVRNESSFFPAHCTSACTHSSAQHRRVK